MSVSKHKIFARMREEARIIASSVSGEQNENEVAHLVELLNQYLQNSLAEMLDIIRQLPMPSGYLTVRFLCARTGDLIGEVNRRDGDPIGTGAIVAAAHSFAQEYGSLPAMVHVPGGDRGVLGLALASKPTL